MCRLTIFSKFADHIIIGHSNMTFTGTPLPLSFAPFNDEIIHFGEQLYIHTLDLNNIEQWNQKDRPSSNEWIRETMAKDFLIVPLERLFAISNNDIIFASDTDELPSPSCLKYLIGDIPIENPAKVNCVTLHYGIWLLHSADWTPPFFIRYSDLKGRQLSSLRSYEYKWQYSFTGVHISYVAPKISDIPFKLCNFPHTELCVTPYTIPEYVFASVICGRDLFSRPITPRNVRNQYIEYIPTIYDHRYAFMLHPFIDDEQVLQLNWTLIETNFSFCSKLKAEYDTRVNLLKKEAIHA